MQPKKFDLSVPDLSLLKKPKALENPPVAAVVHPGDQVVVLLPIDTPQQEVGGISQYLKQWSPTVSWLVMAGPSSITVIPATPQETEQPQGQKPFFEQVHEVEDLVKEANAPHGLDGKLSALEARYQQALVDQLPTGLCGNREDHAPHDVRAGGLAPFWCTADQSKREPYASEKARQEAIDRDPEQGWRLPPAEENLDVLYKCQRNYAKVGQAAHAAQNCPGPPECI